MKTGLFFGSFNPIHIGHLAIANYIVEYTDIQQLWFVVSPQNPFKKKASLLDNYQRLEMLHLAIGKNEKYWASDIEFGLPVPSYTIDTLAYIKDKYPKREFTIIMGSDGLPTFHKWKNQQQIIRQFHRFIYPRPGFDHKEAINQGWLENSSIVNAPQMDISSTFIREAIKTQKDIRFFLPEKVYAYIMEMRFYE
jgi:nicotinate-nucleotide adenylyltransferase